MYFCSIFVGDDQLCHYASASIEPNLRLQEPVPLEHCRLVVEVHEL